MKVSGIYMIQSLSKPERIYVGSAANLYTRWEHHKTDLRQGKHDNIKLQRHVDKYGLDDMIFETVESGNYIDRRYLLAREQMWFGKFAFSGSDLPYFNLCPIAGCNIGVTYSDESKKRMSIAQEGKSVSEETKEKLREFNLGRKATEEAKANQAKAQFKSIYQFTLEGVFIKEWGSLKEAAETLNLCRGNISQCVRGIYNQTGGYIWRFKSELNTPRDLNNNEIGNIKNINHQKPVNQFTKDGVFITTWDSINNATRALLINDSDIGQCCKENRKTAGGFVWKYKNVA